LPKKKESIEYGSVTRNLLQRGGNGTGGTRFRRSTKRSEYNAFIDTESANALNTKADSMTGEIKENSLSCIGS
jgi:hypothetical protein